MVAMLRVTLHCYPLFSSQAETISSGEFADIGCVGGQQCGQDASSLSADLIAVRFLDLDD